jgi:Heparan-alpha-glucosaminide N-acetyltransferase, catalytic
MIVSSATASRAGAADLPTQRLSAVPSTRAAEAAPGPRLRGVDATRGVALLGMMAVHALYSYGPDDRPTVVYSLAAGRSAAVFAVLAGLGIAFLTGRRRVALGRPALEAAASLGARALVIGAVGLALGYVDPAIAAVILPSYALLFVIAVPLVLLPTPALVALGTAIAVGTPVLSHRLRASLPVPQPDNHSFADLATDPSGTATELLLTGAYPVLVWTAYVCVGIAIGRLRLSSPRVAVVLLAVGSAVAAAATGLSAWLLGAKGGLAAIEAAGTGRSTVSVADVLDFGAGGVTPTTSIWWLAVRAPHTGTPIEVVHTTGSAVALLGVLLLLGHLTVPVLGTLTAAVLAPLAAAGSMPLTLYTAHLVFMSSPLDVLEAVPGYVVQAVGVLLFALAWRQAVGQGPLEVLVHGVSGRARRAVAGGRAPALSAPGAHAGRPARGAKIGL